MNKYVKKDPSVEQSSYSKELGSGLLLVESESSEFYTIQGEQFCKWRFTEVALSYKAVHITATAAVLESDDGATLMLFKDMTSLDANISFYQEILEGWLDWLNGAQI